MTDTPIDAIHTYLDAFNAGDADGMSAVFSPNGSILDGMAPHQWLGPTAGADWYRDVLAEGQHLGASGYHVTVGEPLHNDINDDAAYVVLPASMTFNLKGIQITQTAAVFTFAMRREGISWRIASWAWAKGRPAT
jgi:ketosteroid isomerase-like protein